MGLTNNNDKTLLTEGRSLGSRDFYWSAVDLPDAYKTIVLDDDGKKEPGAPVALRNLIPSRVLSPTKIVHSTMPAWPGSHRLEEKKSGGGGALYEDVEQCDLEEVVSRRRNQTLDREHYASQIPSANVTGSRFFAVGSFQTTPAENDDLNDIFRVGGASDPSKPKVKLVVTNNLAPGVQKARLHVYLSKPDVQMRLFGASAQDEPSRDRGVQRIHITKAESDLIYDEGAGPLTMDYLRHYMEEGCDFMNIGHLLAQISEDDAERKHKSQRELAERNVDSDSVKRLKAFLQDPTNGLLGRTLKKSLTFERLASLIVEASGVENSFEYCNQLKRAQRKFDDFEALAYALRVCHSTFSESQHILNQLYHEDFGLIKPPLSETFPVKNGIFNSRVVEAVKRLNREGIGGAGCVRMVRAWEFAGQTFSSIEEMVEANMQEKQRVLAVFAAHPTLMPNMSLEELARDHLAVIWDHCGAHFQTASCLQFLAKSESQFDTVLELIEATRECFVSRVQDQENLLSFMKSLSYPIVPSPITTLEVEKLYDLSCAENYTLYYLRTLADQSKHFPSLESLAGVIKDLHNTELARLKAARAAARKFLQSHECFLLCAKTTIAVPQLDQLLQACGERSGSVVDILELLHGKGHQNLSLPELCTLVRQEVEKAGRLQHDVYDHLSSSQCSLIAKGSTISLDDVKKSSLYGFNRSETFRMLWKFQLQGKQFSTFDELASAMQVQQMMAQVNQDKDRQAIVAFLIRPACRLFAHPLSINESGLEQLRTASSSVEELLFHLEAFEGEGTTFKSFFELVRAARRVFKLATAHKSELLAYIGSKDFPLFSTLVDGPAAKMVATAENITRIYIEGGAGTLSKAILRRLVVKGHNFYSFSALILAIQQELEVFRSECKDILDYLRLPGSQLFSKQRVVCLRDIHRLNAAAPPGQNTLKYLRHMRQQRLHFGSIEDLIVAIANASNDWQTDGKEARRSLDSLAAILMDMECPLWNRKMFELAAGTPNNRQATRTGEAPSSPRKPNRLINEQDCRRIYEDSGAGKYIISCCDRLIKSGRRFGSADELVNAIKVDFEQLQNLRTGCYEHLTCESSRLLERAPRAVDWNMETIDDILKAVGFDERTVKWLVQFDVEGLHFGTVYALKSALVSKQDQEVARERAGQEQILFYLESPEFTLLDRTIFVIKDEIAGIINAAQGIRPALLYLKYLQSSSRTFVDCESMIRAIRELHRESLSHVQNVLAFLSSTECRLWRDGSADVSLQNASVDQKSVLRLYIDGEAGPATLGVLRALNLSDRTYASITELELAVREWYTHVLHLARGVEQRVRSHGDGRPPVFQAPPEHLPRITCEQAKQLLTELQAGEDIFSYLEFLQHQKEQYHSGEDFLARIKDHYLHDVMRKETDSKQLHSLLSSSKLRLFTDAVDLESEFDICRDLMIQLYSVSCCPQTHIKSLIRSATKFESIASLVEKVKEMESLILNVAPKMLKLLAQDDLYENRPSLQDFKEALEVIITEGLATPQMLSAVSSFIQRRVRFTSMTSGPRSLVSELSKLHRVQQIKRNKNMKRLSEFIRDPAFALHTSVFSMDDVTKLVLAADNDPSAALGHLQRLGRSSESPKDVPTLIKVVRHAQTQRETSKRAVLEFLNHPDRTLFRQETDNEKKQRTPPPLPQFTMDDAGTIVSALDLPGTDIVELLQKCEKEDARYDSLEMCLQELQKRHAAELASLQNVFEFLQTVAYELLGGKAGMTIQCVKTFVRDGCAGVNTLNFLQDIRESGQVFVSLGELASAVKKLVDRVEERKQEIFALLTDPESMLFPQISREQVDRLYVDIGAGETLIARLWELSASPLRFHKFEDLLNAVQATETAVVVKKNPVKHEMEAFLETKRGVLLPPDTTISDSDLETLLNICTVSESPLVFFERLSDMNQCYTTVDQLAIALQDIVDVERRLQNKIFVFLTSMSCPLFQLPSAKVDVTIASIHTLLRRHGATAEECLVWLNKFAAYGRLFQSLDELAAALDAERIQARDVILELETAFTEGFASSLLDLTERMTRSDIHRLLVESGAGSEALELIHSLAQNHRVFHSKLELIKATEASFAASIQDRQDVKNYLNSGYRTLTGGNNATSSDVDFLLVHGQAGSDTLAHLKCLNALSIRFDSVIDLANAVHRVHQALPIDQISYNERLRLVWGLIGSQEPMTEGESYRLVEEIDRGSVSLRLALQYSSHEEADLKARVLDYLWQPECKLFDRADPPVLPSADDVELLFSSNRLEVSVMSKLKSLEAAKERFKSMGELLDLFTKASKVATILPATSSVQAAGNVEENGVGISKLGLLVEFLSASSIFIFMDTPQGTTDAHAEYLLRVGGAGEWTLGHLVAFLLSHEVANSVEELAEALQSKHLELLLHLPDHVPIVDEWLNSDHAEGLIKADAPVGPERALQLLQACNGDVAKLLVKLREFKMTRVCFDSVEALHSEVTRLQVHEYRKLVAEYSDVVADLNDILGGNPHLLRSCSQISPALCRKLLKQAGAGASTVSFLRTLNDQGRSFEDVADLGREVRQLFQHKSAEIEEIVAFLSSPSCNLLAEGNPLATKSPTQLEALITITAEDRQDPMSLLWQLNLERSECFSTIDELVTALKSLARRQS